MSQGATNAEPNQPIEEPLYAEAPHIKAAREARAAGEPAALTAEQVAALTLKSSSWPVTSPRVLSGLPSPAHEAQRAREEVAALREEMEARLAATAELLGRHEARLARLERLLAAEARSGADA